MIVERGEFWKQVAISKARPVIPYLLYSLIVTVLLLRYGWNRLALPPTPLTVLGAALTIFLSFRLNTAFARWWEARTLWGGIVNSSRTWARQCLTFPDAPEAELKSWARDRIEWQIDWVHSVRLSLLGESAPTSEMTPDRAKSLAGIKNVPQEILRHQSAALTEAARAGWLEPIRFSQMQATLSSLTDMVGGCERINNTPLPKQLRSLPRFFVAIVSLLLPHLLVRELGWATPIVTATLTFFFFTLDQVGRNVEDPFSGDIHDIPILSLSRTIESNLREALGDMTPPPVRTEEGLLP